MNSNMLINGVGGDYDDDVCVDGVRLYLRTAASYGPIIYPEGYIIVWGAMVE
jgi:hypothetical protein